MDVLWDASALNYGAVDHKERDFPSMTLANARPQDAEHYAAAWDHTSALQQK